ncbi:hypothetical protein EV189_2780 [Motilibacter rhizosphaerae]|uniref:Uncharacterized protein n=1 Tax=Motilibacter rhizosphaerae TaxID=598652 RepID=A0A4Q7NPV0_9ACTN|nr:hypothetical protein [Motilibacter rhizosphaerae]RZS87354.1 hypothetical protein EV189_2780 [Motilibacter rhizosphaerae]
MTRSTCAHAGTRTCSVPNPRTTSKRVCGYCAGGASRTYETSVARASGQASAFGVIVAVPDAPSKV